MAPKFQQGFTTLEQEVQIDQLPVSGHLPSWLSGTLVRNGPAKFEVGTQKYRHWFDGLSMLHRFSFKKGSVSYANKFLQSRDYKESMAKGKIAKSAFATDPCRNLFQRVLAIFSPDFTDNGSVNVAQIANHYIAMTETPLPIEFDPHTLKTLGVFDYGKDQMAGSLTTAHPHFDFDRTTTINYILQFSRISNYYVYHIPAGQMQRRLVGVLPTREPAYMHSFGMTENYVILAEFPLVVNPLKLRFSGKPFIENYEWRPERGTKFTLVAKRGGPVRSYLGDAFFAFHHINAFERDGDVFVDIAAYSDNRLINALYLEHLRGGTPVQAGEFRRYRLPAKGSSADYERLSGERIDLPRINYRRCNGRDYRFAYGVGNRRDCPVDFPNQLVKADVTERKDRSWFAEDCYPGEPVLVPVPGADARAGEDEGVILSVVLNARNGNSFLLVLDAHSFTELARAEAPHHIPFGFHGQYFTD